MINRNKSIFVLSIIVGIFGIYIIAGIFTANLPSTTLELDLVKEWFWYRLAVYGIILASWPAICVYLTRSKHKSSQIPNDEVEEFNKIRDEDIRYLKSKWPSLFGLFAVIEFVFVQKLWM